TSSQLFATVVDLGAKSHAAGMILSMACGLPLVALAIGLECLYASRLLLRFARGQAVSRAQEPELWEVVETLSKACGVPPPRIYVIESPGANAFSTGWHARDAALAITRGLLVLLDRRELEGVVAHELSHIRNEDIRLNTMAAALVATLRLPFAILMNRVRVLFRLHWLVGVVCSIWLLGILSV